MQYKYGNFVTTRSSLNRFATFFRCYRQNEIFDRSRASFFTGCSLFETRCSNSSTQTNTSLPLRHMFVYESGCPVALVIEWFAAVSLHMCDLTGGWGFCWLQRVVCTYHTIFCWLNFFALAELREKLWVVFLTFQIFRSFGFSIFQDAALF